MPYIKLKIRSGGVYFKQEKDWKKIQFGNLFLYPPETTENSNEVSLTPCPEDANQKVLPLVKPSSIKGLFSYLMGETKKITAIKNNKESSIKKLNATLECMVQASAYKKIKEPYITTFFERKDVHRSSSNFTDSPSVNLNQHTFETADSTIKLLEKPLNNILPSQTKSLEEVHSFFKKCEIKKQQTKEYKELESNLQKIKDSLTQVPVSKLKTGIQTALKRIKDGKPISSQVIILIEEICNLCSQDTNFSTKIKDSNYGKFSVFTALSQTKQWVNKDYYPVVRGTPAYIACVDFDIYLSEEAFTENQSSNHFSWEEIIQKLRNGPNIARWGEGGIVLIDYNGLDERGCPYNEKDQMFIKIKALRNAGLKIKKYAWEKEAEKKATKLKSEKH